MKGSTFGPFNQFRIDTDTLPDGQFQATGFDACQTDTWGQALAIVTVVRANRGTAYQECLEQVKNSPEWVEACKLEGWW